MKEEIKMQILLAGSVLIFMVPSISSLALTTFGKTNPQNQNNNPPPPPTPVGKARECKMESDCAGIQNTTCMSDPRDGRTRCLCGDYSAPINGICTNKWKAVRAPCNDDSECSEGAHCIHGNNTMPGKRCYCMEGYYEEHLLCSGSSSNIAGLTTVILAVVFLLKECTDVESSLFLKL